MCILAVSEVYAVCRLSDCYGSRAFEERERETGRETGRERERLEAGQKKKSITFFPSKWSLIKVLSREVSQKVPFLSLWKQQRGSHRGQCAVPSFHLICMLERIR